MSYMKTEKRLGKLERKIIPVLKLNNVLRAGIFGSFARGDAKGGSDIDLLVEMPKNKSLLDLIGLKLELEKSLKKKVDVMTYKSLHPLLKDKILKEEVKFYERR